MNSLVKIESFIQSSTLTALSEQYYFILLFDGEASFSIDFTAYTCSGKNLLFLSPYQLLNWNPKSSIAISLLKFHGDFYCIEYHKEEVSCNGILFNNIYEKPFISVSNDIYNEINFALQKIKDLEHSTESFDLSIIRSYLQLILALSSKEKQASMVQNRNFRHIKSGLSDFQVILEKHFIQTKSVSFYAEHYGLSVDAFSKKIKQQFGKTPSKLIQERLILEAKRLIHLTHRSIKEIARDLGFHDEFYFSKYFKKEVGVSPKIFREKVGISIVAK